MGAAICLRIVGARAVATSMHLGGGRGPDPSGSAAARGPAPSQPPAANEPYGGYRSTDGGCASTLILGAPASGSVVSELQLQKEVTARYIEGCVAAKYKP